ncbi:hypothetical protein [Paracraurococcus lichenis]|uniref:Uncharacterized protein n=1 Tax=Paracraurococcus lichenis TaxID=3064888 RepID=A0ABT9E538_9PROT|nr:hypothetical protein [Paracraurococcus sp. LOR1-02]MDO9711222.1 hypothetical protein [Paracraurococcus sp. LOR1-02]
MTDFVIVVAALANLASASPATPAVPQAAPTVGFRTYATVEACEEATTHLVARPGTRLVCLPVEPQLGELASAY